jgi:hypothetical protein
MGRLKEVVFDCRHPAALARYWAALLDGYAVRSYNEAEIARLAALGFTPETDPTVMVDGPGPSLCFQRIVPPRTDGHRIHLDIAVAERGAATEAALGRGAALVRTADGYTVLADPEGNHFCLVGPA